MHQRTRRSAVMTIVTAVGAAMAITVAPTGTGTNEVGATSHGGLVPAVRGVDHTGAEFDLPYFEGPRGSILGLVDDQGIKVVQSVPIVDWPVLERPDAGLRAVTTRNPDRSCAVDEPWPRQTLDTSTCISTSINPAISSVGTWFVDVPLEVSTAAGPLIFDRWEQSENAITGNARCRTGDQGAYQVPWGDNASGETSNPNYFATAAQFRLWIDAQSGAGGGAEVTAHYALATEGTPDTTAPLVSFIHGPIDCYWYPRGTLVRAQWSCTELGLGDGSNGSGVATCLGWNGSVATPQNTFIDTWTPGPKTLTVVATDAAGNSRTRTIRYFVDAAPPAIDLATTPDGPNDAGWFAAADLGVGGSLQVVATATEEVGGSSMARFACTVESIETVDGVETVDSIRTLSRTRHVGLFAEPPPLVVTTDAIDYSLDSGEYTVDCTAADRSGQTSNVNTPLRVDTVPPTRAGFYDTNAEVDGRCPGVGDFRDEVLQNVPYQVQYVGGKDAHSGLVVPGSGWLDLDVSTPGEQIIQAPTMIDAAGNETPGATCSYFVIEVAPPPLVISAFGPPVNMDAVNVAKAGRTIPFKFTVERAGVPVTGLTAATARVSRYACDTEEPTDTLDLATTAGSSGLIDLGGGEYQYNLQTAKSWSGACFHLGVTIDGTVMTASFAFTR
jgi:hypothetical protein